MATTAPSRADEIISAHEARVYRVFVHNPDVWFTSRDIADQSEVAHRTARLHTSRLALLGVLDQARLFPGYQFRLAPKPGKAAQVYRQQLDAAVGILGL